MNAWTKCLKNFLKNIILNCTILFSFLTHLKKNICREIAFTFCYAENIILQKENIQMYNLEEITTRMMLLFFLNIR